MPYILRDAPGRDYQITGVMKLGREATNAIVVDDSQASRVHATVWEQQGVLSLRDENSSNGTLVNGVRVQQVTLNPGDQIRIGNAVLVVAQARGTQPVPAPAASPTPKVTSPKKSRGGCAGWLVVGCLVALLACGVLGVGGFLAYQSHLITLNTFLNLVGLGPAGVEVDNFRDDTIQVAILQLDVSKDSTPAQDSFEIAAFDIQNYQAQSAGRYRVDFGTTSGAADLGTCTLTLKGGDQYQFVALPDKIVINRVNHPPVNGRDLIVETSTLCQ